MAASAYRKKGIFFLCVISALTGTFSCWYYSFSGKSLPGVESISIPLFDDRSQEFQLKDKLQLRIINTFQEENLLRIEGPNSADVILKGVILSVKDEPAAVSREEKIERTEVHIDVEIKLEERKSGKVLLQERVTGIGFYKTTLERDKAIEEAIAFLTRDIANKVLSGW